MTISAEETQKLVEQTEKMMHELNVPVRDTWKGYSGENLDDGMTNGIWYGPRLLNIQIVADGTPAAQAGWVYEVDGHQSRAHDKFTIHIAKKDLENKHVFVHELVHFLQRTNEELGETYVPLKSHTYEDYEKYVDQRSEREAHFVQLHYIISNELQLIPEEIKASFISMIKGTSLFDPNFPEICISAKENGILI